MSGAADTVFSGGTAVVTGAGSGLGAAMVDRFVDAGMHILALDIDGERADHTASHVRARGGEAHSMTVDVSNSDQLEAAARFCEDRFGGCSVLCANVGVQQFGAIDRLTEQDWAWVIDVNVMGVIRTVRAFLPLMRKTGGSRQIAITSSSGAFTPGIRMAAYTTTKYAVTGYSETLRMELAEEGIGVTTVFPAGMVTRHLESSAIARPAELGRSELRREDIDAMMASRGMDTSNHLATAEHATRHLIADLSANERYVITHGAYRQQLLDAHADVLRAHDRGQEG